MTAHPPAGGRAEASMGLGIAQVCPGCPPHLRHTGLCFATASKPYYPSWCECLERHRPEEEDDVQQRGDGTDMPSRSVRPPEPGAGAARVNEALFRTLDDAFPGELPQGWTEERTRRLLRDVMGLGL